MRKFTASIEQRANSEQDFAAQFAGHYYQAEPYVVGPDSVKRHFQLFKGHSGDICIARYTGSAIGTRRTWNHIRNANSNLYVIWFPLRGSLLVSQDGAQGSQVSDRQMVITYGDRPFHIKALTASDELQCSQLHVLVPAHVMRTFLPEIDRLCGRPYSSDFGGAAVARSAFLKLVEEWPSVSGFAAETLANALLETVVRHVRNCSSATLCKNPKDAQRNSVIAFIRDHISVQGLSVEHVARGCNISPRYVHYIMQGAQLTFRRMLRKLRLEEAESFLSNPDYNHFKIVDIAYMVGFKSAAHFAQSYRQLYGHPPSQTRDRAQSHKAQALRISRSS